MMKTILLSTFVLSSTLSSSALAEQNLIDAPDRTPHDRVRAAPVVSSPSQSARKHGAYIAGSATTAAAGAAAMSLQAELGKRLGDSPAFVHFPGGRTFFGLLQDVSMYEVRAGIDARSRGSIRGFAGIGVGTKLITTSSERGAVFEVVPRFGLELGSRGWFRAAFELPIYVEYFDQLRIPVMLNLGVGLDL